MLFLPFWFFARKITLFITGSLGIKKFIQAMLNYIDQKTRENISASLLYKKFVYSISDHGGLTHCMLTQGLES